MLFLLIALLFSVPSIQSWAAQKTVTYLNENYKVNIGVAGIRVGFDGSIYAKGLVINDHKQNPMIAAKRVSTSILNFKDLINGNGYLTNANAENVLVDMKIYKTDSIDNIRVFTNKFIANKNKKKKNKVVIDIEEIDLKNGHYKFTNYKLKDEPLVDINNINLEGENLYVEGLHVELQSNKLSLLYNNGINVTDLTTKMYLNFGVMSFKDVELKTDQSTDLRGDLKFTYKENDLSDFVNKVQLTAEIKKSTLATNDLQTFYKEFGNRQNIILKTKAQGTINNLQLINLKLNGLSNSVINGDIILRQSASKDLKKDFKVYGSVTKLQSTKNDLENLLPNILKNKLPKQLNEIGKVNFVGDILATATSLNLDGDLFSQIGNADVVLEMKDFDKGDKATYSGNVDVFNFNLGQFTNNKRLGYTSFNLDVNGKGFLLKESDTYIQGNISAFDFKGYTYKDVQVKGRIKDPVFDGEVVSNDPNFKLNFNGLVSINENENDYDFAAEVENIDFNKINIFKRDSISNFKGSIVAKFKGTTIDNTYGTIAFENTIYQNHNDTYAFTDFQITSQFNKEGERKLKVDSPDILKGEISGKFKFKNLGNLFINSFNSLYKNYEPEVYTDFEYVNFDFKIYNKIVDIFFPDIKFSSNTFLKGSFSSDESKFKIDFESPKINVYKNSFENIVFQIDNNNPLYNAFITFDKFDSEKYPITDFSLLNVSMNDTLYVRSEFKGGLKKGDDYDFNLFHTVNQDQNSIIGIRKSVAKIKGNSWYINQQNDKKHLIEFSDKFKKINVDSIKINHDNEKITFNGIKEGSDYKDFKLKFSEVSLENITPTVDSLDYKGLVNGTFSITQKEGNYYPESNINITDFMLNKLALGELFLKIKGNENLSLFDIDCELSSKDNPKKIDIHGQINAVQKEPKINLKASFNKLNLEPFSPLGGIVLSNLRGKVSGSATITGSYKDPDINGVLFLKEAGVRFPYLNVDLNMKNNSKIALTNKAFEFKNVRFTDTKFNTKGILKGNISHSKFKDWNLDLNIKSDRLLVLNTSEKDNELYYGTAFIDGEANIVGPTDKLKISVIAASEEGTQFKIPISDTESVGDNSFIHFITKEEKRAKLNGEKVYFEDLKGIELQFELDLNKNAEVEVIIDPETGNALKGYGAGTLLIEVNTNGKFNIWGDFVAYKGTYDFKYGGIISKRFDLQSGGSINWNGDPTGAILDLSAVYETQANPAILLEDSSINRKIDVDVIITLQGELLKPDLSFDIEFPTASSVVSNELEYLLSDRATKERQALSLVTQGQFYNAEVVGSNAITGNLVEGASSLVNSIFSDEEDKFKIGLDYVQGDVYEDLETSDRVGVTVTTQISNRILINGKVGVPVGGVSESVVVGDVRIDFLLNEDGTLRANIFNKQNDIQFIGETDGYTQGVGLSYSIDFNTFKELMNKIVVSQKNKPVQ